MNGRQVATLALGALLLAPILAAPVMRDNPAAAPTESTWQAVVEHANGESDVVEHGASLSDCMAALDAFTAAPVTYCEREG